MADGIETWYDAETGTSVVNDTNVPTNEIQRALMEQHPEVASIVRWTTQNHTRTSGGVFERDRFVTPTAIFEQFRTALLAAESDDVVAGVLEATESLAFNSISMEAEDLDEEDVWNQIIEDLDVDSRLREIWRELFIVSNCYYSIVWGKKTYQVRGRTKGGSKRKKKFVNVRVPVGITVLDPLKVVPVGNFMFGQEKLAYVASPAEILNFELVLGGVNSSDLIVAQLLQEKYFASTDEMRLLRDITQVPVDNLYLMNPANVFRITDTRAAYQRFSPCRMKSVFELLDLKHQLREMDRSTLLAGTNFIVLVKKGTDKHPATNNEVQGLAGQVSAAARVPIIVGDHRLSVEIVTPKLDNTLKADRYNTIDSRIAARLYLMFSIGGFMSGAKSDDSLKLARIVARGMETRRHMVKKSLERNIFKAIFERNRDCFSSMPSMKFHPNRIALDFDPNIATYMLDLRDRGDLSRDTVLSQIDISQTDEARKREREFEDFDETFAMTNVPYYVAPNSGRGSDNIDDEVTDPANDGIGGAEQDAQAAPRVGQKSAGRAGGGKTGGGGTNPASGKSNTKRPQRVYFNPKDPNNPSGQQVKRAPTGLGPSNTRGDVGL